MKAIIASSDINTLSFVADSAIARDAMPLFVPDDGNWEGLPCIAWRIGRLGKNVAEKFAHRYIDACSISLLLQPIAEKRPQWLTIMDSALTIGQWLSLPSADAKAEIQSNESKWLVDLTPFNQVEAALALITTIATVKTGDILLFPMHDCHIPLEKSSLIEANIEGNPCLTLKIR